MSSSSQRGRGGKRGNDKASKERDLAKQASLSKREEAEVISLKKRIAEVLPAPGTMENEFTEFAQLPLCKYTLTGLTKSKFANMTQIQRAAIPHALGGRDILGAAKTGSGKTLSFIIPILDLLYRERMVAGDGVGAIIISPTRELAMQIFEVLRTVGQSHFSLSAGLVTGGKDFDEERDAIGRMAILVATPGRLLQHLEQSPDLDVSGLRMLVLDEADRLLDMGFQETLNSILSYLPTQPQRQTLLFSATQTKSVRDLARLSLRSPEYLAVHDKAESATPSRLTQHYVITKAQDKLNLLFSFLRSHLHNKTIIFVSSCKEARFIFEAFRRLRPGVPLQCLHGKMKQTRRMLVYYDFLKKPSAALFATDIAARGLDFTGVDWVLQLDCPEDTQTYIHRVGRTARFTAKGHALAVFTPAEAKGMLPALALAKIPVAQIRINPNSAISVTGKLAAEVAADPTLKQLAQRAFASYLRSVALQRDKTIFNATEIEMDAFAESFGLAATPEVKIVRYLSAASAAAGDDSMSTGVSLEDAAKMTPEQADVLRKEAHAKKNSNKGLAKLKQKIQADKEAKRAAAAKAAEDSESEEEEGEEGSDSDSWGSEDDGMLGSDSEGSDSDDESVEKPVKSKSKSKTVVKSKTKAPAPVKKAAAPEEDEADAVMVRRKEPSAAVQAMLDAADDNLHIDRAVLDNLEPRERARMLAIVRDTRAMGRDTDTGGKGMDGMTPFQRIAYLKAEEAGAGASTKVQKNGKGGKAAIEEAATAQAAKLAARLALTADVDRETERARVKEKHRKEKMASKGQVEDEDEGEGEGVQLGGMDEEEEEDGEGSSGSEDSNGDSDSDSDSSSSSSEEEQQPSRRGRAMVTVSGSSAAAEEPKASSGKRSRAAEPEKPSKAAAPAAPLPESVQDMEALALQIMAKKPRKA